MNLLLPLLFMVVCAFLILLPVYVEPKATGIGAAIALSGIPVYLVTISWQSKPAAYVKSLGKLLRKKKLLKDC